MLDRCSYQIKVWGQVDERTLDAAGPLHVKVVHDEPGVTLLLVDADQSGLIGLLRFLHQQGFVLLSACRPGPHRQQQ